MMNTAKLTTYAKTITFFLCSAKYYFFKEKKLSYFTNYSTTDLTIDERANKTLRVAKKTSQSHAGAEVKLATNHFIFILFK